MALGGAPPHFQGTRASGPEAIAPVRRPIRPGSRESVIGLGADPLGHVDLARRKKDHSADAMDPIRDPDRLERLGLCRNRLRIYYFAGA